MKTDKINSKAYDEIDRAQGIIDTSIRKNPAEDKKALNAKLFEANYAIIKNFGTEEFIATTYIKMLYQEWTPETYAKVFIKTLQTLRSASISGNTTQKKLLKRPDSDETDINYLSWTSVAAITPEMCDCQCEDCVLRGDDLCALNSLGLEY